MDFGVQERDRVRLIGNQSLMDANRRAGYQFSIMRPMALHCYYELPYGAGITYGSLPLACSTLVYCVPRLPSFHTFFPDIDLSSFSSRLLSILFELSDYALAAMLSTEYIET